MKWGQKSASIIILSFFCTIYAPLFPKRGVSLYRTNTLKYAVTTSFDATSLMCPPRYGDGRFLPAYRLGRGGFFRKVEITCIGDTMDIVSPDGLSLWYKERLTGNYEITYRVQVVVENGSYDRLSDLNCFWGADDPRHPDDFFARSAWRNGEFKNYNTLDLYYVGYGGNDNGTTRFREYHGEYYGVDDAKIKPILKEYTDAAHLLKPNHWYEVKIRVENGATTYAMDGEELFSLPVADGKGDGYFALRLWQNHVRFADFQVANIDNLK